MESLAVVVKMVSVNKGKWDEKRSIKEKHNFNKRWIRACKNVLNDNGTIWISGTMHNIYSIGMVLEEEGFKILNNITWKKLNPPPNISCRTFVHSTETILWAKKDISKAKHKFNYDVMKKLNNNKQMKDVWETSLTKPSEKKCGKHPTQKPIELLERIILCDADHGHRADKARTRRAGRRVSYGAHLQPAQPHGWYRRL